MIGSTKKIGFFLFYMMSVNCVLAQERHYHDIVSSAVPMVKKVASYLDTEVVDKVLLTTCAIMGGGCGHMLNVSALEWFDGPHDHFDHSQHLRGNVGWVLGIACGYKIGEFAVKLRHAVTDSIVASGIKLTIGAGQGTKKLMEYVEYGSASVLASSIKLTVAAVEGTKGGIGRMIKPMYEYMWYASIHMAVGAYLKICAWETSWQEYLKSKKP